MKNRSHKDIGVKHKFTKLPIILLIAAVFITGCATNATNVNPFSTAAKQLATQAIQGYEAIDEITVNRKIVEEAASNPPIIPSDDTFVGLFKGKANLDVRMKMLVQLRDYSAALGELSNADFRKDIDKAATELYGALDGLNDTYSDVTGKKSGITDDHLKIISTVVDAIGTVIVEKKRRDALKEIITIANPVVRKVSTLLGNEIPAFAALAKSSTSTIETEMKMDYKKNMPVSLKERVEKVKQIRKQHKIVMGVEKYFNDIGKAVKKLGDTHDLLMKSVSKDKYSTSEIVKEIAGLVEFTKSFKKFHKTLT